MRDYQQNKITMSQKILNDAGEEVEVYTAEELTAAKDEAVKAKESEFGKTRAEIEAERDELKKALSDRSGEFKQFRKLNDDVVAKLSVADRTIYENGVVLEEERKKNAEFQKKNYESNIDSVLRAKAGTDEKLFAKMKETWGIIGIDAQTPQEIERKSLMVLGALRTSEPDLMASVAGFSGGSYIPPVVGKDEKSFADTDQGKAVAKELGLILEVKK